MLTLAETKRKINKRQKGNFSRSALKALYNRLYVN